MRRPLRITVVTIVFVLAVSCATALFAAPAEWERVDVTVHSGSDGGVTMVSGDLPASASLPAEGELSVPAGSKLQWIGEILGGAPADDPELKYTKTTVGDSDVYRFTLTKSRTAQIEMSTAGGQTFDGAAYSSALAWTANQDVPEVRMSIRVPAGAQVASPTAGATLAPGDSKYAFYSKTVKDVKAGDQLDLAVAYSLPAVAAAAAAAAVPSGSNRVVPVVLVILVVAAFAGLVFAVRRKMAGTPEDDAGRGSRDLETSFDEASNSSVDEVAAGGSRKVSVDDDVVAERAQSPARAKRNLVTAAIIGVLVVAAVAVGFQTTRPKLTGDTIVQTFSSAEPCVTANIALAVDKGANPTKTAETLFEAIKPIPGLTTATYNIKTANIEIGFCESSSSEAALRAALAPTGMVAAGAAVAPAP